MTMYLSRTWAVRQYSGFSNTEESDLFYRSNIRQGQGGLSVAFNLTAYHGYDPDHNSVTGDMGMEVVAINSVEDTKVLIDVTHLNKFRVSMTMNRTVLPVLAMYIRASVDQ